MKTTGRTGQKNAAQEATRDGLHGPFVRMRAGMAAIPLACLVLALPLWAAEQTETIVKEFKVPAGQTVRIVSPTGRLEIRGVDAGPVHIEAKKRSRASSEQDAREAVNKTRVEMSSDQKGLNVTTQLPRSLPWKRTSVWVDYSVTIPKDVRIEASLASGDVVVEGVHGAQQYSTASGDVRIRGTKGPVSLVTASGDIKMEGVEGEVRVSITSGDVQIRRLTGALKVTGTSGDVDLSDYQGKATVDVVSGDVLIRDARGDLNVRTSSGDISVDLRELMKERVELGAGSGDVRLKVRGNPSAKVEVTTVNGRIHTRIPLTPEEMKRTELRGTIGGGQGMIKISTITGNVDILSE